MNRMSHPFTRLAALATIVLTVLLLTAGRAAAMRPDPAPSGSDGLYEGFSRTSELVVTNSSVSSLQWVLFAAAVIAGLLVGAASMHLAQQRRTQLAR